VSHVPQRDGSRRGGRREEGKADPPGSAAWQVQAGSWGRGGALRARKAVLGAFPEWPAAGGGRGEGGGPQRAAGVIIWSRPGLLRPPPGLWLLRAESGVSFWVLSWGHLRRGCPQAGLVPAGPPEVGDPQVGLGARGRGSLCGTGTGFWGTRWDGAPRRRGGRDCGAPRAWWLGLALGQGQGRGWRAVWGGGQQQWPTLRASAAGACGGAEGKETKRRDIFRILGTDPQPMRLKRTSTG
jgi:hypothetical protein